MKNLRHGWNRREIPAGFCRQKPEKNVYLRITLIWIQTEGVDCINVDQDKGPVAGGCGNDIYICVCI